MSDTVQIMSKNWCDCREYLIGTLHQCKVSSQPIGVHCDKTPSCVFVHGHGGDCRISQPGDGDLSDEIRMRVLRDRATTEYQRGLEAAAKLCYGWHYKKGGYGALAEAIRALKDQPNDR